MSELSEMFHGQRYLTLEENDEIVKNGGGGSGGGGIPYVIAHVTDIATQEGYIESNVDFDTFYEGHIANLFKVVHVSLPNIEPFYEANPLTNRLQFTTTTDYDTLTQTTHQYLTSDDNNYSGEIILLFDSDDRLLFWGFGKDSDNNIVTIRILTGN